jgi:MarR family transcriptional regulator, lower aerobic nicotinate degradation pathway regulator
MRNAQRRVPAPPQLGIEVDPEIVTSYRIEAHIGYLIRRAHQRATSIFEAVMAGFEVTPVQFAVLAKLHDLEVVSQNQLGRLVGVDPATMNGVAARLAARGLVTQNPDRTDARLVLLRLSPEGSRIVEAMKTRGPAVTARTLDPLNANETAELARLLAKIG